MSILIKGMEMPKNCPCELLGIGYDLCCSFAGGVPARVKEYYECCQNGTMPSWCPLVPVPPHGRLGDLDEFAKVVLNWITTQEKAYPNEDSNALSWRLGARAMGHQIYRDIEAAPTIIPAEEGE